MKLFVDAVNQILGNEDIAKIIVNDAVLLELTENEYQYRHSGAKINAFFHVRANAKSLVFEEAYYKGKSRKGIYVNEITGFVLSDFEGSEYYCDVNTESGSYRLCFDPSFADVCMEGRKYVKEFGIHSQKFR